MLKRIILAAALSAATLASASAQDATQAVETAYAAWNRAFNAHDPEALAKAYTDDALLLAPDHKVRNGTAGVTEFFGGLFAGGVIDHTLELIEADGDGDIVYATAKWSAQAKGARRVASKIGGIATHVFERQEDGSLRLKVHTFN